jgi:hypothetical protein
MPSSRKEVPVGRGTRFLSWSIHLLLIAIALRGIFPDAQDLALLRAMPLLCSIVGDPSSSGDEDDGADDVCGFVQLVGPSVRRLLTGNVAAESNVRLIGFDVCGFVPPRGDLGPRCGSLDLLCRRKC